MSRPSPAVRVAIVGDFNPEYQSHHAINASLAHSADAMGLQLESKWVATECAARDATRILESHHGVFISSGSPYRSMEGAFAAIRFARTMGWPLIGT